MHNHGMFDWNDLRHFLAVVRAGSTLAAAKELRVSQPTVQRRLTELEERMGCKLFERHAAGYRLTEIGEELRPYAEGVEIAILALERKLAARDQALTGTIRVTCPEGMASLLTPLLESFHAQYPGMRVDLVVSDRYLDLSKGEADIALRAGGPRDDALVGRKIADNPWAIYASRSYLARHRPPAGSDDINKHTIIDMDGDLANLHAAKWLRMIAPHAKVIARSNSLSGLLLAVNSGVGLTALPVHIGDSEPVLVRVLDPVPELMSRLYLFVHPDLRSTPRVRAFFDFVIDQMEKFRPLLSGKLPRT